MRGDTLSAIRQVEDEICTRVREENGENLIYADLTGLYVDIISEVSRIDREKAPAIYFYANLLEQEIQLYSPVDAYEFGVNAKGQSEEAACLDYLCTVARKASEQGLSFEIQKCFDAFAELLGDRHGLISEFTELYREVHGTLQEHIHVFVQMGQAANGDSL